MDRLDELSVFIAILDAGSLASAARRLHRSPPSVTRALSALEGRLGARLVDRTTRRLALTEVGQRFDAAARRALTAYDEALRRIVDDAPRGVLRITAPLIFGRRHLMPVLASFLDAFPAMQAELSLADHYLDLLEEGLDLALRIGPESSTALTSGRRSSSRRGGKPRLSGGPRRASDPGGSHESYRSTHRWPADTHRVAVSCRRSREGGALVSPIDCQRDRSCAGCCSRRAWDHPCIIVPGGG
jgi:hypothetical protein